MQQKREKFLTSRTAYGARKGECYPGNVGSVAQVLLAFLKVSKSQVLANRHQHIWHITTLGQQKRLRSLRDLDEAALALAEVCSILLDDAHTDDAVRTAVLTRIPREQIAQAITTTSDLARPPEEDYQEEMLTRVSAPYVASCRGFRTHLPSKPRRPATWYSRRSAM